MKTRLKRLQPYIKNVVVAVFALMMLVAYLFMSPWQQFNLSAFAGLFGGNSQASTDLQDAQNLQLPSESQTSSESDTFQAPEGFEPPAGFQASEGFQLPEGTQADQSAQVPQGLQLPTGTDGGFPGLPESPGRFLIPIAAVIALVMAGGSAYKPRYNRLATGLTVVAGLAGLAYYVIFFVQDALIPINIVDMATAGFWVGLVGSAGLILQAFIPHPREVDPNEGDVREVLPQIKRRSGLSLRQNLGVSFDALLANKLRSGLTMLGVVIGVASVVSLLSVGRGAQASITGQIEGTGINLVTISPGADGFGPGGGGSSNSETLTYSDAEAIAKEINGLTAVLPQYSGSLRIRSDQDNLLTMVLGITPSYAEVRNIEIELGRYITEAEHNDSARVAVLGESAAKELFGGLNPIGREIRIDGTRFEVVGILEQQDSGFGSDPNLQVYVPLTTAYRHLFNARATGSTENLVSSIIVSVEDTDQVSALTDDIEALLRERHRLEADEDNDFSILDQQQLLSTATSITGILTVLLGAIASISLLVGGIGIMNIMLVSVTERTKEIGLRKAIGARRSHILQQFLIETIFLSTLGGLIGVALGVLIAMLVNNSGLLATSITADSVALGLGFSIIIGVFFGVYPANQAAALEPIEALRYE